MMDSPQSSAPPDILLIEDEHSIAEAVRFILTRDGWVCAHWAEGSGALARIRALRPRLVILDLMLPGRSGADILSDLRADNGFRHLPVLLLTARGLTNMPEGATRILAKPFANADLRKAVHDMLAAR